MGYYADERVDYFSDPDPFHGKGDMYTTRPDTSDIWTMRDGTTIRFEDMEPMHRQNCIDLLIERHGKFIAEASYTVRRLRELGAGYYFN